MSSVCVITIKIDINILGKILISDSHPSLYMEYYIDKHWDYENYCHFVCKYVAC